MEKKPLLPTNWPVVPLGRIFEKQDVAPKPGDGVVTAFRDGNVMLRSRRRLDGFTESLKEIGYQRVNEGDLVIHSMDAFAGAIGVAQDTGKSTPVYIVLKPKENIYPKYYSYVLRAYAQAGAIQSLTQGIRERSTDFRWSVAKSLLVPLPPYKDQKRIADELDRELTEIDEFIADQYRLLDLIDEKFRVQLEKLFIENCSRWVSLKRLGITKKSGFSANGAERAADINSEIGVLKTGSVTKDKFLPSENKLVDNPAEIEKLQTAIEKGSLIVNRANTKDLVGSIVYADRSYQNLFLSDLLWSISIQNMNPRIIYLYSKTQYYRRQIAKIHTGTSSTMQKISYENFKNIQIPLLSPANEDIVLNQIKNIHFTKNKLISEISSSIFLLKSKKSSLLVRSIKF